MSIEAFDLRLLQFWWVVHQFNERNVEISAYSTPASELLRTTHFCCLAVHELQSDLGLYSTWFFDDHAEFLFS